MKEQEERDDESCRPIHNEANVQKARTNMALLHFILTAPKWSISLFLFLAARQSPLPTFEYGIKKPLEYLRVAFDMEGQAYQECALNAAVTLEKELQLVAKEEYDRVSKIHETSEEILRQASKQKDQCLGAAKDARDLLIDWQNQGYSVDLINDTALCGMDQREEMERLLGGEAQLLEEKVTSAWNHHVQESLRGFHLIRDYTKARTQYDYDYFIGLRIRPALDFVASLPRMDYPALSIDKVEIQARLVNALEDLRLALRDAEALIEALKRRVEELSMSVEEFYLAYLEIYNRLEKASVFVADFLPPGVPLPAFFDMSGFLFAEAMLPAYFDMGAFDMDMAAAYSLIDQTTQTCMRIVQYVVEELKEQSARALRGAIDHIGAALLEMLQLEDYDPPKFVGTQASYTTIVEEVEYQESVARVTLNGTKELLARLSSVNSVGASISMPDVPSDSPVETFAEDPTSFAYLRPTFPAIFVPRMLEMFVAALSTYTWLLDVAIQALRLWRLESTYSKAAIPDLPEISYESPEKETEQPKTWQVFLFTCLRTFLTPRMLGGVMLAPFLLTAIALWYPHVKSSCKDSRDGTFLATRFLAPMMINDANALGNSYYLKAELQCYKAQGAICRRMQAQTINMSAVYQSSFSNILADFEGCGRILSVIADCVNANTTHAIRDSCCGIKGYIACEGSSIPGYCPFDKFSEIPMAFRPLREYLGEESCTGRNWPKEDLPLPTFDCNKMVKVCEEIPCLGVSKDSLRVETVETDCQVELYAVDFFFFVLLAIFHAVTLNLISTLLFNGLRSIAWRKLYPEGVVLKARLREDGSLATGDDHDDRLQRISVAIKRFELAGKLQIALGIALLIVWTFVSLF